MHLNGLGTAASCPVPVQLLEGAISGHLGSSRVISGHLGYQVAVQFLKAVAERGPWGSMLMEAHDGLLGGREEAISPYLPTPPISPHISPLGGRGGGAAAAARLARLASPR